MQNNMKQLSMSCAEAKIGSANDLSQGLRDMELKLQIRMDEATTDCNDTSARLEREFMDVAFHLDAALTGKATEINTKMDDFVSAMDSKLSRELTKHEEVLTFRRDKISKEDLDLKESVAELKRIYNSDLQHLTDFTMQRDANVTEQARVQEKINDDHHQQLVMLCSAVDTPLRSDVISLGYKFDEANSIMEKRFSEVSSKMDIQTAASMEMLDKINCILEHNLHADVGSTTLIKTTTHSDNSQNIFISECGCGVFPIGMCSGLSHRSSTLDSMIDEITLVDPEEVRNTKSPELQIDDSENKTDAAGILGVESRLDLANDLNSGSDNLGPGIVGSDETETESGSNIKPVKIGQLENGPDDIGPEIIDCDEPRSENATTHSKVDTNGNCLEAIHTGLEAINRGLEAINQKMAAEAVTRNKYGPNESGPNDISRESEPERDPEPEPDPVPKPKPEPVPKPKPGEIDTMAITRIEISREAFTRTKFGPAEIGPETINHADVTSSDSTKLDLVSMLHAGIELHNMQFLFTDISRGLMTFQARVRFEV
jgi:hypothetical protein